MKVLWLQRKQKQEEKENEIFTKTKRGKTPDGEHALCYDGRIVLDGRLLGNGDTYAKVLQKGIKKETGMQYDIGYGVPGRKETGAIVLELDETRKSQQYVLQVTEEEIRIQGGDGAGVLYGVQTLCQMIHEYGALLPAVRIEDEPDLPVRGYYLDETRGRVLTLSYLKQVADRMAYYKLNQLQLYVEHTYLFSGLSEMWRDETPLTAEEIRELDAYCAKLISNWCRRSQRSAICTCCSPQRAMATSVNSQTAGKSRFPSGTGCSITRWMSPAAERSS